MPRQKTLRERIEARIARKRGEDVFLTREFNDLGGEDQVLRALRSLLRDGHLVRLGYGVYGRAFKSRLSGKPVLQSSNGFISGARDDSPHAESGSRWTQLCIRNHVQRQILHSFA